MRYSQRILPRLRPRTPTLAFRFRPFFTSTPKWTPPHVEYPSTATKQTSYATPLLPLPSPPTQPASKGLFVLYVPQKPEEWPSHIEMDDPLVDRAGKEMALQGIRMIVAHDSTEEGYHAKLLTSNGLVSTYPSFAVETLDSPEFRTTITSLPATATPATQEILVCTHGARDCRCSDIGGDLVIALHHEVAKRRLEGKVRVTECAHVGGHKWAANAILLPTMTFLSNLRPTHAPLLMDHLINPSDGTVKAELWRSHFRGLIGQPVETQVAAYEAALHTSTSTSQKASGKQRERKRLPVRFTTADGTTHDVSGYEGESLMEIAKREELGAVEGTCGGHLECATCHMYVPYDLIDPPRALVPDLTDAEEDMLDYALGIKEEKSRLGCRLLLNEGLSKWSMEGEGVELPEY